MTDNQIVMLMERCYKKEESVVITQFNNDNTKTEITLAGILGVVNRKQAEIERLHTDNSSMQSTLAKMSMGVEEAKAEAIKEFAERLKAKPIKCSYPLLGLSTKDEITDYFNDIMMQFKEAIDNLVKEKVGEG